MNSQLYTIPLAESNEQPISGTLFENVYRVLGQEPVAQRFFDGQLPQHEWIDFLEQQRARLVNAGIPAGDVDFAKRYPGSVEAFVQQTYQRPEFENLLALPENWQTECYDIAKSLTEMYEHQGTTYIYPEEGYLIYTLAKAFQAKRAIFLGSYYGYWAAWAMPAIEAAGGSAVLIDPDPQCCELAERNLSRLYPDATIEVACTTAQEYLANYDHEKNGKFDFTVLDAELPNDYPDEALRGKGLYFALLDAVLPHITDPSLMVCHNILLNDETGSNAMQSMVAQNQKELTPFLKLVGEKYQFFTEILSTEGMGVGLHKHTGKLP
ncbi:MAG: Glutamate synthase [NADPH] large chain (EC [uncultured Thiotrichaceae bacterium]|uniref:Glutamate synthase [NADPH] large chain (EC) n=1 Tax=uncultured Thiotrichaceae bacterium TaxID=298394 RepID=A0A6S6U6K3_9GAMM|nr:MAG: Glutamate synthase [NADPH] large chain (EC [uncultured Thiotrichaceae bacterium]